MMGPESAPVDHLARQLITRDGLDRTLFVDAGAGTGKTKSLVDRMVNLVELSGVRLERLAAITFTEAAASELRDRIRSEIDDRLSTVTDATSHERLSIALGETDVAAISTLHAFCLRILNERPVDVGLPPRVEMVDEVSSQLEAAQRWKRFVDELYDDPEAEELVIRAHTIDLPIEGGRGRRASVRDVAQIFDQNWDRLGGVRRVGPAVVDPDLTDYADAVSTLESHMDGCGDPSDKFHETLCGHLVDMKEVLDEPDLDRQLSRLSTADWRPGKGGSDKRWGGGLNEAKEALRAVNDAARGVVAAQSNMVLERLATRLADFVVASADERRRSGRLEFHDLLVLARQLLRTSSEARRALHDRYERLLLDEFQDTDPLQIEVACLIAASLDGEGPPGPWHDVSVEEGRLFFVGDPKQSIYRFRRADVRLYLEARDAFAGDEPVNLVQNFRSVPAIIDWVNHLFGTLLADDEPGRQAEYVPLAARRVDSGADHPAADHVVKVLGGASDAPAAEIRAAEADDVAEVVADIRAHPDRWPIERDGRWVDPKLSDVTILLPTRTSLHLLEQSLECRDLPYRVDTGTLVYGTQEIHDLLAAISAVDDPSDELALVTALRSPLYACSDRHLYEYRKAGGRWGIRERRPDALAPDHPVIEALDHFEALWQVRSSTEPSGLIDRIVRERRAFVLAHSHRRPREVWRRYRFVLDQARLFAETVGGDLRAFVEWSRLQAGEGSRVHEPLLPETDDDALRILTIHGAKGLEFPITILSGMSTELGRARTGVVVHWDADDRPAVKLRKDQATDNFDRLADIEAEMSIDESKRLLYVACTRARDHLVVSAHHPTKRNPTSHGRWIAEHGPPPDGVDARRFEAGPPPPIEEQSVLVAPPADGRDRFATERETLLEGTGTARTISATAVARLGHREVDENDETDETSQGADASDATVDSGDTVTWRRGRAGSAIGRAVHASLQLIETARLDEQVEVLASQQAHIEAIDEHAETVAAMVRSALASPLVADGLARRHWRELFVAAPVGERVIEGYVDLLVDGREGLVVVDYKTDTVRSETEVDEKLAHYRLQAASYAVAIEVSTGRQVVGAGFVFCRPSGAIERMIDDLPAAKAEVLERLDARVGH